MDIKMEGIPGLLRESPLVEGQTIADDFENIPHLASIISDIECWWRPKEACPFARGNLIVDFKFKDEGKFCLKLPYQTTLDEIKVYLAPLLKLLKEQQIKERH